MCAKQSGSREPILKVTGKPLDLILERNHIHDGTFAWIRLVAKNEIGKPGKRSGPIAAVTSRDYSSGHISASLRFPHQALQSVLFLMETGGLPIPLASSRQ